MLYLQWGRIATRQTTILQFGIAFETGAYYVRASVLNDNKSYVTDWDMQVVNTSTTEAELFMQVFTSSSTSNDRGYLWIAIGQ